MITFLLDSSAAWRLLRDTHLQHAWSDVVSQAAVGSCAPQRAEFRRSARNLDEYEEMTDTFSVYYPDVPVPKGAWRWIDAAQYRLCRRGAHRALSAVDLMVCASAAAHGLVILHDDNDFVTAAGQLTDVAERRVHDLTGL